MKMGLIRVHATIRYQAEKMKLSSISSHVLHGIEQYRMFEEFAVLNHQLDTRRIHVNDAPRADVQMSNFAIAHLIVRQADVLAAGMNQSVGIFAQESVVSGLAGKGNRVGFGFSAVSPAIEDDEDKWFRIGHKSASNTHKLAPLTVSPTAH